MEERRRANRRELESKLVLKRLDGGISEEAEISILDVSKSGIGFSCAKLLEIGSVYEAFLRIWTQEVIHAFLEVVRIEKKQNEFCYGAVFIGMPEMDAARIEVFDTVESLKQGK